MDLQPFLALSAGSLSAVFIAQLLLSQAWRLPDGRLMIGLHAIVILIAYESSTFFPDGYGFLSVAALIVVMVPNPLLNRAGRFLALGKPDKAAFYARLAAFLHPSRRMRFLSGLHAAMTQTTMEGRVDALNTMQARATPDEKQLLALQILRQRRNWPGLLALFSTTPMQSSPESFDMAVRALGETGRLDAMVATYLHHSPTTSGLRLNLIRLMVLAFAGRVEATRYCLATMLRDLPPFTQAYWMATALQAVGRREEAQALLQRVDTTVLETYDQETLADRLASPVGEAAALLSLQTRSALDGLEQRLQGATPQSRTRNWRETPVTYALILANCAMYGVEMYTGDPQDTDTLLSLGALWPDSVLQGHEYWRVVSAMFLHAGPEHLISNMFALWVLGRFVEMLAGPVRTLLIYGIGGILSMAGVLWLDQLGISEPNVLVGASGAIFALFGAIAYRRIADYLTTRAIADRQNLTMILTVLGIQAVIDLSMPQISFSAHIAGLVAGVALGLVLLPRRR